jgi:hypothetical protein
MLGILEDQDGDRFAREIALLTGEVHPVREIAADARSLQLSADGRFASYQLPQPRGSQEPPTVRVLELGDAPRQVYETTAIASALAPDGSFAAFISPDRKDLRVLSLADGTAREVDLDGLLLASLSFAPDASHLYAMGRGSEQGDRSDIYRLPRNSGRYGPPERLSKAAGFKVQPQALPGGRFLLYGKSERNPIPDPNAAAASGRRGARGRRGRGRGGFRRGRGPQVSSYVLMDLQSGEAREFAGRNPAPAADGSALAFTRVQESGETSLHLLPLTENTEEREVFRTEGGIASFAIAPDASRFCIQTRPKDDWELFMVSLEGEATPLSQEIQHDLNPTFLDANTVMARMGEPRHRRAQVYDLSSGERIGLFHNNSIRTIAPQYEWLHSADGKKVLILSERDGNTVTPDRSAFLVDRSREVSRAEVIDRLEGQLRKEQAAVTESVAIDQVYGYQKALSEVGSRHITQPGNKLAEKYLAETFSKFGYEPVIQALPSRGRQRSIMGGGGSANVYAVLKGTTHPELIYVLGSHYDSVSRGPGADDNASGTAVTMEAARVLAKHPQAATIIFVCFTGEESGLLGSREFVRRAAEDGLQVVGALNNDMLGWSNDFRLDNTIRYSNPGIRDVQHNAAMRYSRLITYDALYYKGTDAAAFYDGWGDIVGGIGSYPVLGNPHYHQATDLLDTINQEQVTETSRATVATLMLLASSPSRLTGLKVQDGGMVSWTPSREQDVVAYELVYGPANGEPRAELKLDGNSVQLEDLQAGDQVRVRAVNERGLAGWDWARVVVD